MTILSVTLSPSDMGSGKVLSNGNLTVTSTQLSSIRATHGKTKGKWYWEVKLDSGSTFFGVGIANTNYAVASTPVSDSPNVRMFLTDGRKSPEMVTYGSAVALSNVIGIALDLDNFKLEFYKNGISMGVSHTNIDTLGELFPVLSFLNTTSTSITANFGATAFAYPLPSGYKPFNEMQVTNKYLFQDGTDIKKWTKGTTGSEKGYAVPILTSNAAPTPYVVSATSVADTSGIYEPWKAFQRIYNNGNSWDTAVNVTNAKLTVDMGLGNEKYIGRYEVYPYINNVARAPKSWTLEASNDDVSYTVLDTQTITNWVEGQGQSFSLAIPTVKYRYYRLNITGSNGATYISIGMFNLYEWNPPVSAGWSIIGTATATKSMFDTDGMSDLSTINNAAIQALVSASPELLVWTDEVAGSSSTNEIPVMTSNTAPSGEAFASSNVDPFYDAWKAFDAATDASSRCTFNSSTSSHVGYKFTSSKVINKYKMQTNIAGWEAEMPSNFTFEGSNDGVSYTVLDTKTGISWTTSPQEFVCNNQTAYLYYRVNMTNGTARTWTLTSIAMFINIKPSRSMNTTAVPNNKLVIPVGDITVVNVESIKLDATQQGFLVPKMTGANSPSPMVASASVETNSTYTAWKAFDGTADNTTTYWSTPSGTTAGWLKLDFGSSKIINRYVIKDRVPTGDSGTPKSWTFEGSNDGSNWTVLDTKTGQAINMTTGVRSYPISNMTSYRYYRINVTETNNGQLCIGELEMYELLSSDIKVLASGDSGVTWKANASGAWQAVDASNLATIKSSGMTPTRVNALTASDWAGIVNNGKMRLAFYLEQATSADIVTIDKLTVNEKQYTMTPTITSLSVLFNLLQSVNPDYYVSRDDGVTWKKVQPDQLTGINDLPIGNKLRVKAVLTSGQELQGISYTWI